jgi:putative FmdB family regulatory protein
MPSYDHECYKCGHQWELFYSINKEPPSECPKCKGKARRVILTSPGGSVILTGHALKEHISEESMKVEKEVENNENFKANIIGEENYHNTQINTQKIGEELRQMI